MKTYTICGSMRFTQEMKNIAYHLEVEKGYNILQCIYVDDTVKLAQEDLSKLKLAHYRKIDMSDGIYVVNINGYIGESMAQEIEYATTSGKEVIYHLNSILQTD